MGQVDLMVFFWDPMEPQGHDVKVLLRISVLYNIPVACNRSSADFLISSPLLSASYRPIHKDYGKLPRTVSAQRLGGYARAAVLYLSL